MAVQDGEHHERVAVAGAQQPVEEPEGGFGVAAVDGIGEVPGRDGPGLAQVGRDVDRPERGALAIGRGQHVEEGTGPADVLGQMPEQQRLRLGVEPHPRLLGLTSEPGRGLLGSDPGVDDLAVGLGRRHKFGRHLARPAGQDQHRRRQWIFEIRQERLHLVGHVAADLAYHDHPPVGQEGRRGAGISHRRQVDFLAGEVLHRQRPVAVADQVVDDRADRPADQDRIVAVDQDDRGLVRHLAGFHHCGQGVAHPAGGPDIVGPEDAAAE